jgi:hypothetical protein
MNCKFGGVCKDMVLAYFNTLSLSLSRGTEKSDVKLLKRADFEPKDGYRTFQLRNRYYHAKPGVSRYDNFILFNDHTLQLIFMFIHNGTSVNPQPTLIRNDLRYQRNNQYLQNLQIYSNHFTFFCSKNYFL